MTENESTNAQESMPLHGIMQSGWYAAQDDDLYLYIDQWVKFDRFLVVHTLKKWSGDKDAEVEDNEHWYNDFDFKGDFPQLFTTKEECKSNDESRQAFNKAKYEMETNAKDSKLIAALKEFNDGDSANDYNFICDLQRVLGKMGCDYCYLSDKHESAERHSLLTAIKILREKSITSTFDRQGRTVIPLSSISRTSLKDCSITIEMNSGETYRFPESSGHTLYEALREVFGI